MFADDLDWYFFNAMTTSGPERFFAANICFAKSGKRTGHEIQAHLLHSRGMECPADSQIYDEEQIHNDCHYVRFSYDV